MPELPEVETIKRGLQPLIERNKILECIVLEKKSCIGEPTEVEGAMITSVGRRGKALIVELDNGKAMIIHLRLTGQLIYRGDEEASGFAGGHPSDNFVAELPNKQTRVIFVFNNGKLFFNDQRKFGFVKILPITEVENDNFIKSLAPEPWQTKPENLFKACQRHKKAPIKAVLLDQKIIAGIGNIYADEALHYAGVLPSRRAGDLCETEVTKILEGACKVMTKSIESGGSTMATYVRPDGSKGDYLELFAEVFRREGKKCNRCGGIIEKTRVAGRGTHYCPGCQK